MNFITLNSGHSCEWPMNRLTPVAHTHCLRWLKAAVRTSGPSPVPGLGLDARLKLARHPDANTADSVMLILERGGVAVITYTLCIHAVRQSETWDAMTAMAGKFGVQPMANMPLTVPWLLAVLLPPCISIPQDTLPMCADFAGCIATILLEKESKGEITP